jgi:Domain of unknown function DUF29
MPRALYDEDFFLWSQEQAALLRDKKFTDLDLDNLAEEIESLGKRDRRELESRLRVLMTHLLKWRYQSAERSGSWRGTITEQRLRIQRLLRDSPSLLAQVQACAHSEYPDARTKALDETGLLTLPETCPFTAAQILDTAFWPEA